MIQIGDLEIAIVSDGLIQVDAGGPFGLVPRALYKAVYVEPNADNQVPMVLNCLLVRAGGKNIVIDTGLGERLSERAKQNWALVRAEQTGLRQSLARLGLSPADINVVINTHLHSDHCGGNTLFSEDQKGVTATFPNAEYVVQRREYEDAMHPNERSRSTYFAENFQPLVQSGQMRLLDGDTEILPGIYGMVTPGHTPGHMCIRFESRGQSGLFVADLASFAVHFERLSWMTAYDIEPLVTLETKRVWQQWALETNAVLIFQHDVKILAGHYAQTGDRRSIIPLAIDYD